MTDDQWKILQELLDLESGLTEWEIRFLDNIRIAYEASSLSKAQAETLQKLADRLL